MINEIIIPYAQCQRKELGKPKQAPLVIMDVFRGQITYEVKDNTVLKIKITKFWRRYVNLMTQFQNYMQSWP